MLWCIFQLLPSANPISTHPPLFLFLPLSLSSLMCCSSGYVRSRDINPGKCLVAELLRQQDFFFFRLKQVSRRSPDQWLWFEPVIPCMHQKWINSCREESCLQFMQESFRRHLASSEYRDESWFRYTLAQGTTHPAATQYSPRIMPGSLLTAFTKQIRCIWTCRTWLLGFHSVHVLAL